MLPGAARTSSNDSDGSRQTAMGDTGRERGLLLLRGLELPALPAARRPIMAGMDKYAAAAPAAGVRSSSDGAAACAAPLLSALAGAAPSSPCACGCVLSLAALYLPVAAGDDASGGTAEKGVSRDPCPSSPSRCGSSRARQPTPTAAAAAPQESCICSSSRCGSWCGAVTCCVVGCCCCCRLPSSWGAAAAAGGGGGGEGGCCAADPSSCRFGDTWMATKEPVPSRCRAAGPRLAPHSAKEGGTVCTCS
jgi:hypothetical protein